MKNTIKIFLCLSLVFSLVLCVAACGKKDDEETTAEETTNVDYDNDDSLYSDDTNGFDAVPGKMTLTDFMMRFATNVPSYTFSTDTLIRTSDEGAEKDEYALMLYDQGVKFFVAKIIVDPQTQFVTRLNLSGLTIGTTAGNVNKEKKSLFKQFVIGAIRAYTGKSSKQALDVYLAFDLNNADNFLVADKVEKKIDGCNYSYSSAAYINSFTVEPA